MLLDRVGRVVSSTTRKADGGKRVPSPMGTHPATQWDTVVRKCAAGRFFPPHGPSAADSHRSGISYLGTTSQKNTSLKRTMWTCWNRI